MRKIIINLLCIISVVTGLIPTCATMAEKEYNASLAADILKSIGIISDISVKKITKDSFITSLAGFLYDNPKATGTAEYIARSTGMLEVGELYNGTESIRVEEAVKYAVVTLGYKPLAKQYGGDFNAYFRVASELDLTDGLSVKEGNIPEVSDLIKLLYQMLEIEPMSSYYKNSTEMGFAVNKDESLLSLNRGIYLVKGIHDANQYTSIYKEEGCIDGCIEIEGVTFDCDLDTTDLLGKNVIAYVKETSNNDYKVIYIGENDSKNDVIDISAEDIYSISDDYSVIEYLKEDRSCKVKISSTPSVIYNGILYGKYEKSDLLPDVGGLTLIDNNSDGRYDIIQVEALQTVVVDSINLNNMIIKNKYDFDGCLSEVVLENEDCDIEYTILKNGSEIGIADIKPYNILSVAESKNNDKRIIKIYVSEMTVEGNTQGKNDDDEEITFNGVIYPVSEAFQKYFSYGDRSFKIGETGKLYLDAFGNAAYYKPILSSDYYMLLRVFEENDKYYAIYMDINEEWETSVFADKISLNGENVKTSVAYQTELQYLKMEIVKFKKNSDGELKKIDLALESAEFKENKFTRTPEASYTYRYYEKHFDHMYYLNEGAKAFVLPESYTADKSKYSVQTVAALFDTDVSGCQISAYDIDEFNFTDLITIKDNTALENSRSTLNLFVVTSVGEMYLNGDVEYGIKGNMVNYRNLTLSAENETILENVEVGDIVRLSINGEGKISAITHVASAKNFVPMEYVGYTTNARMAGVVSKFDIAEGKIKIKFKDTEKNFRLNTSLGVLTYDVDNNKCSFDDVNAITVGKKIICRLKMGRIEEIIVIDEEKR